MLDPNFAPPKDEGKPFTPINKSTNFIFFFFFSSPIRFARAKQLIFTFLGNFSFPFQKVAIKISIFLVYCVNIKAKISISLSFKYWLSYNECFGGRWCANEATKDWSGSKADNAEIWQWLTLCNLNLLPAFLCSFVNFNENNYVTKDGENHKLKSAK